MEIIEQLQIRLQVRMHHLVNVKENSNFTETGLKTNKPKVKAKNVLVVYKFYKMSNESVRVSNKCLKRPNHLSNGFN